MIVTAIFFRDHETWPARTATPAAKRPLKRETHQLPALLDISRRTGFRPADQDQPELSGIGL